MAVRAAWGAPTCPRLRTRPWPTAVCSPCPGPVALGRRGFSSSSSVRRSSLPSPCSVPPRSFLVNSLAGRGRMLGCCRLRGDRAEPRPGGPQLLTRGGGAFQLTWVQVCHAVVTVTWGCAVVAGHRFPEGLSGASWPVAFWPVLPPLPLVQEAGGHERHTLLLTRLIWETHQLAVCFLSTSPWGSELSWGVGEAGHPPPAIWVKQWKLAVPVGPVPTGTRGQCGARARGQDDGRGLWAWSTCSSGSSQAPGGSGWRALSRPSGRDHRPHPGWWGSVEVGAWLLLTLGSEQRAGMRLLWEGLAAATVPSCTEN